ncbi:50S ribosomal protein L28 [candidate division NPL-UPA2 bacterium]|nr:50S ribosomal protein L28 [candidate division NPL-UPA2 bacterium]
MSRVCDICGKEPSAGYNVSHSHRKTKRRWLPNLQRVRAVVDGVPKRLRACTACIRSGKVKKPNRAEKNLNHRGRREI